MQEQALAKADSVVFEFKKIFMAKQNQHKRVYRIRAMRCRFSVNFSSALIFCFFCIKTKEKRFFKLNQIK